MDSLAQPSRVVKFGVFEVDLELCELRKHGVRLKLGGQPFEVLRILLERPQQIVTREELQKRLWPADVFVDYDLALKKAINRIREVLGDDAESPRFVETIPRRGYRFIATINANGNVAGVQSPVSEGRHSNRLKFVFLGVGTAVLVFAVLGYETGKFSSRTADAAAAPGIHSLAVLPLQNLSGDPAQEYFSDGMTDALITDLAQIGSLKVISRTSSMQYKQTRKSLPEIARELNVDGIVEGTVQRSRNRVRITAQLIYGPSDKHVWANSYEDDMHDAFMLEREVAGDIVRQVQARITTQSTVPVARVRPLAPEVLDAYLEGNYHLYDYSRGSGDEEKRKASELFQQVIDAEPNFAPAYVGLARAHLDLTRGSTKDLAIAKQAAESAVQVDPTASEGWLIFGEIKEEILWDWAGAEADYRKATILNPNNAWAHRNLGEFLGEMGRLDEGLRECEIAQELDPEEDQLLHILYLRREYDRGIAIINITLKTHSDDGYQRLQLYENYTMKGMYRQAVEQLEQALGLFGLSEAATHVHTAYARAGYAGAMRQWAKELEHLHDTNQAFLPANLALTYAALDEKDHAFYWLDQAFKHRDIVGTDIPLAYLVRDPMADPLRSDPRFADLVHRMGLPP
jgi:TolB-like protein/DNA-binding winged helix-turn-helix (wHTH) protein/tetratricopeptide (TPR) repeat protein